MTVVSESKAGKDLLAQPAHQRVRKLSAWDAVLAAFGARSIAPRLRKAQGLPEALQRLAPADGYLKAPNGVLTESHAWDQLIRVVLGTVPENSLELTRALLDPVVANRLAQDSPEQLSELVAPMADRLEQLTGPAAAPMLACVSRRHSKILVPAGLVARVAPLLSRAMYENALHGTGFEAALESAIEHLSATPSHSGDLEVILGEDGIYRFADPALEALSAPQKQLLRLGARNGARVREKLRELSRAFDEG